MIYTVQGRLSWAQPGMLKYDKHLSHTVQGCLSWKLPGMLKYDIHRSHTVQGCLSWKLPGMLKYDIHRSHTVQGCLSWKLLGTLKYDIHLSHCLRLCGDPLLHCWISLFFYNGAGLGTKLSFPVGIAGMYQFDSYLSFSLFFISC